MARTLTDQHLLALAALYCGPPRDAGELAMALGIEVARVIELLDDLEQVGAVNSAEGD